VFEQTPGAAVFKMICINCHGPRADSNGRLAQNLATMTGGHAAVADFRDGLFGPPGAAEGHRNADLVFGGKLDTNDPRWTDATVDDRAARYMAWMGLGGTSVNIPTELLEIVAVTRVLSRQRVVDAGQLSANMLSQAKSLCRGLLGTNWVDFNNGGSRFHPGAGNGYLAPIMRPDGLQDPLNTRLIVDNGDAELWLSLCSLDNPAPVHILNFQGELTTELNLVVAHIEDPNGLAIDGPSGVAKGLILPASMYPLDAKVGNAQGTVDDVLDPSNTWPWCVDSRGASPTQLAWVESAALPSCPQKVLDYYDACIQTPAPDNCFGNDAANRWAVRGAINAGMAVYTYVQSIENQAAPLDYNQCALLK
jgi:hypothetical protein